MELVGRLKLSFKVLCIIVFIASLIIIAVVLSKVMYPLTASISPEDSQCDWPDTEENRRRAVFCAHMDMQLSNFEELCRCDQPWSIDISPKPLTNNRLNTTPVIIIASDRAECLYRTLHSVLSAYGANLSLVTVFLDAPFPNPIAVAKLYKVNFIVNSLIIDVKKLHIPEDWMIRNRIDKHYKLSISKTFELFPNAEETIILEDDLEVSPDFFSYFSQTIHLLHKDRSIYCISAWNDFSYRYSSQDPSQLYRVDNMPGLGWMLKKSLYQGELESKWPVEPQKDSWDGWLRLPAQRKDRECIMPDVCRTFHFSAGSHISSWGQRRYFNAHSFNKLSYTMPINTTMLTQDAYENLVKALFRTAKLANHLVSVCSPKLIPDTANTTYVVYIKGRRTLLRLMNCFKLWDVDFRPGHKDMWRFWYKSNHILVVRCPESQYCIFKPNFVTPIEETLPLFLILYGKYIAITTVVIIAVTCSAFIMKKTVIDQ